MAAQEPVVVGRVARTYGTGGELLITLYETFPQHYSIEEPLFVVIDGLAVPLFCNRFERRGRSGALAVFSGLETERRAAELLGLDLFLEAAGSVPGDDGDDEEGRIYLEELVGWRALLAQEDALRGEITGFIDGENPLFLISVGGREVFVPAVDEFVTRIDEKAREIVFDLPEGLVDLN